MNLQTKINARFDDVQASLHAAHAPETADDRMNAQIDWEATHPERSRRNHNQSGNFIKKSLAVGTAVLALAASVEIIGRAVDQSIHDHTHSMPTITHSGHEK